MDSLFYPFRPKPLPYAYDALEPAISAETLRIHYDRLYLGYIEKLNDALKGYPNYWRLSLPCLLIEAAKIPCDVRVNVLRAGGGVFNHELYFDSLTPEPEEVPSALRNKIESRFFSVEKCLEELFRRANAVFGSGYAALVLDRSGALKIISFENQDTGYLCECVPLLVLDVWEHSYFLDYKNLRADYIKAAEKKLNWQGAADRLKSCFGCF